MLTVNGKTANYQPNRPFGINNKPNRLISPEINGLVPYHININGLDRPAVLPDCVFYAPLWHPALSGATFKSLDKNAHLCTVTGATWGIQGRTFDGNDSIDCGSSSALKMVGDQTWLAWVTETARNTSFLAFLLGNQSWGVGGISLSSGGDLLGGGVDTGKLDFRIQNAAGYGELLSTSVIPLSIPTQVGVTWVAATRTATLFLNGIAASPPTVMDRDIALTDQNLYLGKAFDNTYHVTGKEGEAFGYNRSLSAQEITRVYLSTKWRYQ